MAGGRSSAEADERIPGSVHGDGLAGLAQECVALLDLDGDLPESLVANGARTALVLGQGVFRPHEVPPGRLQTVPDLKQILLPTVQQLVIGVLRRHEKPVHLAALVLQHLLSLQKLLQAALGDLQRFVPEVQFPLGDQSVLVEVLRGVVSLASRREEDAGLLDLVLNLAQRQVDPVSPGVVVELLARGVTDHGVPLFEKIALLLLQLHNGAAGSLVRSQDARVDLQRVRLDQVVLFLQDLPPSAVGGDFLLLLLPVEGDQRVALMDSRTMVGEHRHIAGPRHHGEEVVAEEKPLGVEDSPPRCFVDDSHHGDEETNPDEGRQWGPAGRGLLVEVAGLAAPRKNDTEGVTQREQNDP
ncbi:MAG: hypothetical protein CME07_00845 [Gemmatimonadetes bacterium]|nr:hypothetical protein [Gemmatimonadota bacterium]